MKYNPDTHHRRSIRLKEYDYSMRGLYFVTICTHNWLCLFGKIENGVMFLNDAGMMIEMQWRKSTGSFDNVRVHDFVVMPNHFHGVVEIVGVPLVGTQNPVQKQTGRPEKGQPQGIAPTKESVMSGQTTVGGMVGAFKSLSTNEYIRNVKYEKWKPFNKRLWQRNYYEHIIRNEESFNRIAEYVQNNPLKWQDDEYYRC